MKRNILITGSALTIVLAVFTSEVFSQPGNYATRYPPQQQNRGYQKQWQQPASPFTIIDADGRLNGYNGRNFNQCYEQRSLSRKQRRKLEKRFGFPIHALNITLNLSEIYRQVDFSLVKIN